MTDDGIETDDGRDELQRVYDDLAAAQTKINTLKATLRECRKHWEGTDAPILQLIDWALS